MNCTATSVSTEAFLQALWPDPELPGHLVVWTKTKAGPNNDSLWCTSLEEAAAEAERRRRQREVYFGVALQDREKALAIARRSKPGAKVRSIRGTSASAVALPGLWVDIDIQAEEHASGSLPPDLPAALQLLQILPVDPSIVVHSGHGLHVYWLFREPWILETDEERREAETLAKGLQAVLRSEAQKHGWTLDNTADLARVLRLPGTLNHKGTRPKVVKVSDFAPDRRYNPGDIRQVLPAEASEPPPPNKQRGERAAEGDPASLASIRSECSWVEHCYQERATLPEPEWYALLSILGRCKDGYQEGRELAHAWSRDYPGYSPAETDRKLDRALRDSGPRTCTYIAQELGADAEHCSKCEHWQRVKSPIQLGRVNRPLPASPYRATPGGFVHLKGTKDGPTPVQLTNFTARIVAEVIHDDGVESSRSFEIEASHCGKKRRFTVGSADFPRLNWVLQELGTTAIVYAGVSKKDHTRVAIQTQNDSPQHRTIFAHLGWRQIDGESLYLHCGGAIGTDGTVADVEVLPPEALSRFTLPHPPHGSNLTESVRASLGILDLLPDPVIVPIYCGIWRAVAGNCDFALHLAGQTGQGKSEVAALAQQHWGAALDARHLPASWSSTGNALEGLAFAAKDVLLVVDDFAPEGSSTDVQRMHKEAARLLRAQGNQAGRQRMRADATLRPTKAPRGLILSTGEDIPKAQSVRARMLTLELPIGGMDWGLLGRCQTDAANGLYSQALAGFVQWLAGSHSDLEALRDSRVTALRSRLVRATRGGHKRTPSLVADLAFGMELFLRFAQEVKALSASEAEELSDRTWKALRQAAADQEAHLASEDPVERFLELLRSAISAGNAHLTAPQGGRPETPERFGWRESEGFGRSSSWEPKGLRVGWTEGGDLYLDPPAAFGVAQQMATSGSLSVTDRTLWKRLSERKKLASRDTKRNRNTIRKSLQGSRREVLHLSVETLLPQKPSQPSQPSQNTLKGPNPGTVPWDSREAPPTEPSHGTVPGTAQEWGSDASAGTVGTVGTVSRTTDTPEAKRSPQPPPSELGASVQPGDFVEV